LDPRTNDRSLVMTSSFSNMSLAGICLIDPDAARSVVEIACLEAQPKLDAIGGKVQAAAQQVEDRSAAYIRS
jgi:hypothetical protein